MVLPFLLMQHPSFEPGSETLASRMRAALASLSILLGTSLATAQDSPTADELDFFEREVRPLLVARCYDCHAETAKGGLRLDSRAATLRGGDSGPALVPGEPDQSLLVKAVRAYGDGVSPEELRMPPKGKLSDEEIAILERWVALGAPDPRTEPASSSIEAPRELDWEEARDFWSFRRMGTSEPPAVENEPWVRQPLDRFILSSLEKAGLTPAPEADRRTLIRRLSFDLTGLPPSAEEVEAFVADPSPDAYEALVERLLASPHYGERWARYWLDLARYSDSNGLDENLAYANAWRYRDYVVRALNEDKPYDRFITEQLAGDLLPPDPKDPFGAWIATGFLVLGPKMLAEQDKEKLVIDVVDEQIDVTSRAILGLTVACARCHDHKFDPIPSADYYALAGVLKSTSTMANLSHVSRWRERELATPGAIELRDRWLEDVREREEHIAEVESEAEAELSERLRNDLAAYLLAGTRAAGEVLLIEAEDFSRGNLGIDATQWGGPLTTIAHTQVGGAQWVEYDVTLPMASTFALEIRFAAQESRPMQLSLNDEVVFEEVLGETTGSWMPDSQRWFSLGDIELRAGRNVIRLECAGAVPHLDKLLLFPGAASALDSSWPESPAGLERIVVRRWAEVLSTLESRDDPLFAAWRAFAALPAQDFAERAAGVCAELDKRDAAGELSPLARGVFRGLAPKSLEEVAGRYQALFTTAATGFSSGDADDASANLPIAQGSPLAFAREILVGADGPFTLEADERLRLYAPDIRRGLGGVREELALLRDHEPPAFDSALAVIDGEAQDVPVHIRGSHRNLASEPVPRGTLRLFDHAVAPPVIPEGSSGRLELARWLTDPEHPLTARVIANRVWLGHFGRGLVQSPSNFGIRGDRPSHPELLDWLARTLIRDGWSLKALHRRIVTSSAYRMASRYDAQAAAIDPENRLVWRMNRRRLEAEAIRDSLLAVSGELDRTVGGTLLGMNNAAYVTNDQSTNQARYDIPRRSLYLPIIRNAMYDFFAAFDYNDPSVPVDWRPSTTVAHQALFLMNSPLAIQASEALARRLIEDFEDPEARLAAAYGRALGRRPTAQEAQRAQIFLAETQASFEGADLAYSSPVSDAPTDETATSAGARQEPAEDEPTEIGQTGITHSGIAQNGEQRAWAGLAQVLLSSNEFLYVD